MPDEMFQSMRELIGKQVRKTGWPLYLHGPPGHGKTCFAGLIYASADGYGASGSMWYPCRRLLGSLAQARVNPEQSVEEFCRDGTYQQVDYWTVWGRLRTVGLVVIDDLGRTPLTEVQSGILCEILDMRQSLMTLLTGNYSRTELESELKMDGRLISRICSGTDFFWAGRDRRTKAEFGADLSGGQGA